jgi:hypothetical protein
MMNCNGRSQLDKESQVIVLTSAIRCNLNDADIRSSKRDAYLQSA